jgi:hypothetical protein
LVQIISYYQLPSTPPAPLPLKYVVFLRQRQALRRLSPQHFPISFDGIRLRVDLHLRHEIIPLHILLPDVPAIFHRFDPFLQPVFRYLAGRDARGADECDACSWDERREHRTHDHGLDGRDGGVGVALLGREGVLDGWVWGGFGVGFAQLGGEGRGKCEDKEGV